MKHLSIFLLLIIGHSARSQDCSELIKLHKDEFSGKERLNSPTFTFVDQYGDRARLLFTFQNGEHSLVFYQGEGYCVDAGDEIELKFGSAIESMAYLGQFTCSGMIPYRMDALTHRKAQKALKGKELEMIRVTNQKGLYTYKVSPNDAKTILQSLDCLYQK